MSYSLTDINGMLRCECSTSTVDCVNHRDWEFDEHLALHVHPKLIKVYIYRRKFTCPICDSYVLLITGERLGVL